MVSCISNVNEVKRYMSKSIIFDSVLVIDFFSSWCKPYRKHIYDEIAKEVNDVDFYKVDYDEDENVVKFFDIEELPTVLIIKKGDIVKRMIGTITKDDIMNKLGEYVELEDKKELDKLLFYIYSKS